MGVVLLYGLRGEDGKRVLEARLATPIDDTRYSVSPKDTIYSCAYQCPLGLEVAAKRAHRYVHQLGHPVIGISAAMECPAVWQ